MGGVRSGVLVAAALLVVAGQGAAQDDAETRRAIRELLDVGWSKLPGARAAADAAYMDESVSIAGDLRGVKAWTLVLLQQGRYEEASKQVDQWLEREPNDWFALRARVWLSTLLKNYQAAMLSAEKLAERIASADPSTASEDALRTQVEFLGRIYGFLGGPAAANVIRDDRRNSEKRVLAKLGEQWEEAFTEARDGVLQRHLRLTDARTDQREKAKDAEAAERERTLAEVAAEREKMKIREGEIQEQQKRLREEMTSEVNELQRQDRPLAQQFASLDAQAAGANRELASLTAQIRQLEFDARRERDPVVRGRLFRDADRLRGIAAQVDRDLQLIERQAAVVQQQRAELAGKLRDVQNNYGGQIAALDRELQGFAKREKRLAGDEARARKPISGTTGQVLSLGAQAAALTTYDTLPLEEEKSRLVEELAGDR